MGLLPQSDYGLQPGSPAPVALQQCPELPASVAETRPQHPRVAEAARRREGRSRLVHVELVGQPETQHPFRKQLAAAATDLVQSKPV